MADYKFYAFFVASKVGKASLTPTVNVYGPGGAEVTGASATEIGGGLYSYTHTDAVDGDYTAVFITADATVDAQHVPALAVKQISSYVDAIKLKTDNLPSDPADQSALEALFTAIKGAGWSNQTLVAIKAAVDAVDVSGVATAVWANATRTLTQSAASVAAAVAGSTITCQRGDTLTAALTDIGALTGYSKLWFTVKENKAHTDAQAVLFLEKTAGLTVVNGEAHTTTSNGTITVSDEATGDITITIKPAVTDDLPVMTGYYDIQMSTAAGVVSTLTTGTFTVNADVTRAVS